MAGVCLIALATPTEARAQDATQDDAPAVYQSSEIVVTTRRRDELLQDVAVVVNPVTAEDISDLNLRDFTEVQSLAPGLSLSSNANGIGGNAQVRGVNFDINASGNNPTVEFYFNDAPITAGVILQQMFDIGQIEVQRGPQGTLRGRASPSGAITVTARKPDMFDWGGYTDWTANDIGTINLQGGLNVPVVPGVAALRVSGVWNTGEGDRVKSAFPTVDGRDPFNETWAGRVVGVVEPTDWLHLEGTYQRTDAYRRSFYQNESFSEVNPLATPSAVPIEAEDRLAIQNGPFRIRQIFDIFNWRAEAYFAGQSLIYQGQHYTQEIRSTEPTDWGNFFPDTDLDQVTRSNTTSTSHEIRLQNDMRLFDTLDYVIGFFDYKNETPTSLTRPTAVRLPVVPGVPGLDGGLAQVVQTPIVRAGESHEQSFFGNLTVHLGDFQISGGVRHIDYRETNGLMINGSSIPSAGQDDTHWIYSGSIQYDITPDVMIYASTGTSYRPGINVVGDFSLNQSALERSFLALPPETSESYEVGLKTSFADGRGTFNIAGYYQKFENFPYRVPGNGVYFVNYAYVAPNVVPQVASFNFAGAVPVEVKGVEADASFEVIPGLNISATASYSLGKIKDGVIPCTDLNGDGVPDQVNSAPSLTDLMAAVGADNISACTVNQRSSFLPPFTATLQGDYNFAVSGQTDAFVRGLFTFNGESQGVPTNEFDDVDSYGLLNVFLGLRDAEGGWEVSLYAKNLLDETTVLTRTDPRFTSYQQLGFGGFGGPTGVIFTGPTAESYTSTYTGITTTPPREFGLNVKFRFGSDK
ncbi:TonB-dependent receptor [Sphingosinithalassobacter tenebrarum]|uniref:TonB-dependent receptor n=2 Tax=Stakelama tenebrarum TaxID=2711215 RepID=A0A6G6YAI7_9SPHN|nr:TonB-dependent receptor [Sphingosinithalassobacter tenebrarum]